MPNSSRLRRLLVGKPRDILHPKTYHAISLVAVLAWVGLGADGLSSSAYGPDEAFRALGSHRYLAVALALATTFTVATISLAYSQIIKRFPFGGGGYVVATELLGSNVGVVSGAALLVDYALTISVSIASGGDQVFSVLPASWAPYKLLIEAVVIGLLVIMNIRGVRESVTLLAPIFGLFILTHAILIFGGIGSHFDDIPRVTSEVETGFRDGLGTLGLAGLFAVFLRAFTMGGGTFTGIEAVSNGVMLMREPKVETARRTMLYMAVSLAVTASGLLIVFLLFQVQPEAGKTLNAVVLERFAEGWRPGGLPGGHVFVVVTLVSVAALLFVAAQTGFLDGPRIMSSMSMDDWLPHRFSQLSERLTVQHGVLLMGGAALATLFYARGDITALVTMYSINVFVTFSLSQLAMLRYWTQRERREGRGKGLAIHGVAFLLCSGILVGTLLTKFEHGGWVTFAVTSCVVGLCFWVRAHYRKARGSFRRLEEMIPALPSHAPEVEPAPPDPKDPTAVLFVSGYGGLGIHVLLTIQKLFVGHFKNFVFASVAVVDAAVTKGIEEVERQQHETEAGLQNYVELARRFGLSAGYRMKVGIDAVDAGEELAKEIAREHPRSIFFMGTLVFKTESWYHRVLHNQTANRLQRRLQFAGLNAMVLPVRVLPAERAA